MFYGTSSETITQDIPIVEFEAQHVEFDSLSKPPEPALHTLALAESTSTATCPKEHQAELQDLKEHLSRGSVPNCFYIDFEHSSEKFLNADEKAKLALFRAIHTGLKEAAQVFQPKRYKDDFLVEGKRLPETTLWFRAFWPKVTASQASQAFQSHIAEGRRFPAPVDVLDRVTDARTARPEQPAKRKYY